MDGSTDSTMPGAGIYTKRWEPQEEMKPGNDIYGELARQAPEVQLGTDAGSAWGLFACFRP